MKDLKETEQNKIYFLPGDVVTLKQDIPNKPIMLVIRKETSLLKNKISEDNILKGIKCRWFTTDGQLQEAVWTTKDLFKIS